MNTRSFYKLCLVACLAIIATVLILQMFGVGLWKGGIASERIPLTVMKETGFLALDAHIDSRAIRIIVDTAANETTLDIGLIEELDLATTESPTTSFRFGSDNIHVQRAHVKSFKVGNLSYKGDFFFADLSHPNMGLECIGDTPVEGLLGSEFLVKWDAVIDYEDLSLIIRKR